MDVFDVSWAGPIPFTKIVEGEGIPQSLKGPGIYIWTVQVNSRHVAYYVGETGRSIRDRTIEHYKVYVHGEYRIYDPIQFQKGDMVLLWGEAFGVRWPRKVSEYLHNVHRLAPAIEGLVNLYEVYALTFDQPLRLRKRLEAETAYRCRLDPGSLQNEDIKYAHTKPDEDLVTIRLLQPIPVAGLKGITEIKLEPRKSGDR
jgi:hypothetical protein